MTAGFWDEITFARAVRIGGDPGVAVIRDLEPAARIVPPPETVGGVAAAIFWLEEPHSLLRYDSEICERSA